MTAPRAPSSPRTARPPVRKGGHVAPPPLTRDEVIEALRARFREGKPFSGAPSRLHLAAAREFGSWSKAMIAATTTKGLGAITATDVLLVLRRLAGQRPTMTLGAFERSLFAPALRHHFATIAEAVEAAGLVDWPRQPGGPRRPAKSTPVPPVTRERRPGARPTAWPPGILEALRQRLASGASLDARVLQAEAPELYDAAQRHGWMDLLYAAIHGRAPGPAPGQVAPAGRRRSPAPRRDVPRSPRDAHRRR